MQYSSDIEAGFVSLPVRGVPFDVSVAGLPVLKLAKSVFPPVYAMLEPPSLERKFVAGDNGLCRCPCI